MKRCDHKWRKYGWSVRKDRSGTVADWQTLNLSGAWWCKCGTLRVGRLGHWTYHYPNYRKGKQ